MLRRPRKPKFQRVFRVKALRPWAHLGSCDGGSCLQARRCFKLS